MSTESSGRAALRAFSCCVGLLTGLAGCGTTVDFNVLRAARVNVSGLAGEGNDATVSIGRWSGDDGSAVEDFKQRLTELITNAEGGVVTFAMAGGVVQLDGEVSDHAYKEEVTSRREQCSRQNEKTKKTEKYPCTINTRRGTARIRVSMNVVDHAGKVVGSDSFADKVERTTQDTDNDPPPIDGQEMLASLRAAGAAKLAVLVVPHRVVVSKPWFGCGDADDMCDAGLTQLRAGNFGGARSQFERAIDRLRTAPQQDGEALAGAWWGIVLASEFGGQYVEAQSALERAIELDPSREAYAEEDRSIRAEAENSSQLAKQGALGE
jgi:tetratricopeptide (TPR) repeat protein